MSTEIERKVVDMQFNNRRFERNINESISSLDKLKASLNFNGLASGLEEIDRASNSVDFSGLSKGVETVTAKFSYMQVAVATVIQNITNDITNAVKGWTKQLTTSNITSGWDKYAEKTSAIQTIMAATAKDYENEAEQMDDVNKEMDRMTFFADETSYSISDMTDNVGKFTSNNVKLNDAVTAMEGIALAAALAGTNSAGASRAMYNFSQALGVGAVKAQDWSSIETANMATSEFKETIIKTAADVGTLIEKNGKYYVNTKKLSEATGQSEDALRSYIAGMEGMSETVDGIEVTVTNFRNTLSEGWFDSDVLIQTLNKYGSFADQLAKFYDDIGELGQDNYTTSELIKMIDQYKSLGNSEADVEKKQAIIDELVENTALDAEKASYWIGELTKDTYDLGRRAFKVGQEAKTFKEAIDSVKDAASTKWSNIFEAIFGNYLEAKEVWTSLANYLYDLFVGPVANILKVFNGWKTAISGIEEVGEDGVSTFLTYRQVLMKAFGNIGHAIEVIKETIVEAFEAVFGVFNKQNLIQITDAFYKLSEKVILSEEATDRLRNTFIKIFTVITKVWKVVKIVAGAVWKIVKTIAPYLYTFVVTLADGIEKLSKSLQKFSKKSGFTDFLVRAKEFSGTKAAEGFEGFVEALSKLCYKVINLVRKIDWDLIAEKVWNTFASIGNALKRFWGAIKPIFTNFASFLIWAFERISNAITGFRDKIKSGEISTELSELYSNIKSVLWGLMRVANVFLSNLANFVSSSTFTNLLNLVKTITGTAFTVWLMRGGPIYQITDTIEYIGVKFANAAKLKAVKNFGMGILMIAGALLILTSLDPEKAVWASQLIIDWIMNMAVAFILIGLLGGGKLKVGAAASFSTMGTLLLSLAVVMGIVGSWNDAFMEKAKRNMGVCIDIMTHLLINLGLFALFTKRSKKDRGLFGAVVSIYAIIGAFLLFGKAVEKIGNIPTKQLNTGISAFKTLLSAVAVFMILMSDNELVFFKKNFQGGSKSTKNILASAVAIVAITGAMWIFAQGLYQIKDVSASTIWNSVLAFSVLLAAITAIAVITGSRAFKLSNGQTQIDYAVVSNLLAIGATITLIAGAMWIFAKAMYEFQFVSDDAIWAGLGVIAAVLAAVTAAAWFINKFYSKTGTLNESKIVNMATTVGSVVILSASLYVFAKAFQELEKITDPNTFWKGIIIFGVLAIAVDRIAKAIEMITGKDRTFRGNIGAALSILVVMTGLIASLGAFALAVRLLSGVGPKEIVAGVVVIGAIGLIAVELVRLASKVDGKKLLIAAGAIAIAMAIIPVFAIGMMLIFEAMKRAPVLTEGQFQSSLMAMIGVLLAITAGVMVIYFAKVAFAVVIGLMLALTLAIAYLARSAWQLADAFHTFSALSTDDMSTIKNNLILFVRSIPDIFEAMMIAMPVLITKFGLLVITCIIEVIYTILTTLAREIPRLVYAIETFVLRITEAGNTVLPFIFKLLALIVDSINNFWPYLEPSLVNLFNNLMHFLIMITPSLVAAILNIITELVHGIRDNLPLWLDDLKTISVDITEWSIELLKDILNAIGNSVSSGQGSAFESGLGFVLERIWETLKDKFQEIFDPLALVGDFIGGIFAVISGNMSWSEYFRQLEEDFSVMLKHIGIRILKWVDQQFGWLGIDVTGKIKDLEKEVSDITSGRGGGGGHFGDSNVIKAQDILTGSLQNYIDVMKSANATDNQRAQALSVLRKELSGLSKESLNDIKNTLDARLSNDRSLTGAARAATLDIVNEIKDTLGIHSPSTVFENVGKYCIRGFNNGITSEEDETSDAFSELKDNVKSIVADVFGEDDFTLTLNIDSSQLKSAKAWIDDNLVAFDPSGKIGGAVDFVKGVATSFNNNLAAANGSLYSNPQSVNTDYNNYMSNTFNITGTDDGIVNAVIAKLQTMTERQSSVWKPIGLN